MSKITSYAEAGVDRKLEEASVNALLATVKKNLSNQTMNTADGMFAGGIELGDKILSLATDGVGTKVLVAEEFGQFNTIGVDCVAMNVNDLLASGSLPVAFVDYIAIREPNPNKISSIVEGVVEGCNQSGIPLVGGETAIMPEVIQGPENRFDLAGTALGISDKANPIISGNIKEDDVIIGVSSSGIHSNGLTLARKVFENVPKDQRKELLIPTRIYVNCVKECFTNKIKIHGMAHITGGGLRNLLRLGNYLFDLVSWPIPSIFNKLSQIGEINEKEMYNTFNMGIGFVIIVAKSEVERTLEILNKHFSSFVIGTVKPSSKPRVTLGEMIFEVEI